MVMDNGNVRWFTLPGCKTCSRLSQRGMSSILLERVALRATTIWIPRTHFKQGYTGAPDDLAQAGLLLPCKRDRIRA